MPREKTTTAAARLKRPVIAQDVWYLLGPVSMVKWLTLPTQWSITKNKKEITYRDGTLLTLTNYSGDSRYTGPSWHRYTTTGVTVFPLEQPFTVSFKNACVIESAAVDREFYYMHDWTSDTKAAKLLLKLHEEEKERYAKTKTEKD
jgi:hypothetical protein